MLKRMFLLVATNVAVLVLLSTVGTALLRFFGINLGDNVGLLVFAAVIGVGVLSMLTFLFLRQEGTAGADTAVGEALVAIYDRAFLVGPGIFAGVANGMILGYLMYRTELVPRGLAMLGLIGGPLLAAVGVAIMFDVTERGSTAQALATIPEFIWELSFGIYLIAEGFRPAAIQAGLHGGLAGNGRRR